MAKTYDQIQGFQVTAGRPLGQFSNESSPGAGDGTPIIASQVNEIRAFLCAILKAVDPSASLNGLEEQTVSQQPGDKQFFDGLTAYIDNLIQGASSRDADPGLIAKRTAGGHLNFASTKTSPGLQVPSSGVNQEYANSLVTPIGTILPFGSATIPQGWFECNGASVSRTTYSNLFSAIGTIWGAGDGSTTFNLPDLRSRMPVGAYPGAIQEDRAGRITDANLPGYASGVSVGSHRSIISTLGVTRFSIGVSFIIRAI